MSTLSSPHLWALEDSLASCRWWQVCRKRRLTRQIEQEIKRIMLSYERDSGPERAP